MKLSIISRRYNPAPVAYNVLTTNPMIHIPVTTFSLFHPNLSLNGAATASVRDTDEVTPANQRQRKNKIPKTVPIVPISVNTAGNTTNASPTPLDTTSDIGTP